MQRDLVIVRAGRRSLHSHWIDLGADASWDLYVCPFEELAPCELPNGSVVGDVIPGPKWSGLRQLLNDWSGWRDYRYVMLADDDLLLQDRTLTPFFEACASLGANLAQPALSENSPYGHLLTLRNSACAARAVSLIEIMLPTFKSEVLADLLWTLDLTETGWGWGLDVLWGKLLNYERMIVTDNLPVTHTRPVGRMRDPELEKQVWAEYRSMLEKHDAEFWGATIAARLPDGSVLAQDHPALLYTLIRGYSYVFDRNPGELAEFLKFQTRPRPKA